MTAQEQQMLQGLVDRVNQTQLPDKDAEAEQMLGQTLGRNPDALYILAQTVLVQGYALEQAQKQLADARTQMEQMRQQTGQLQAGSQPAKHGSFLGNLLGLSSDEPQRPSAPQYAPVPQYASQPQYAPVPQYQPQVAPGYGGGYAPGFGAPQQGGFLRSAMQTATGVAAGALAFEGIESLMHGFGHAAGYGSDFGGGFGGGRPEEVINNYYGDSGHDGGHEADRSGSGLGDYGGLSPDIEDRRGDSRFTDAVASGDHGDESSVGAGGNDAADAQDFSGDDSTYDDGSSSADDSGGDFDSGGGDDQSGGDGF